MGLLVSATMALVSCKDNQGGNFDNEETTTQGTAWGYFKDTNTLTGETTALSAYIESTNRPRTDGNGNTARLAMKISYSVTSYAAQVKGGPANSVFFTFIEDDNLCHFAKRHGSGILVIFDNGEVDDTWKLIFKSSDERGLMIYEPQQVDKFISRLKTSKTCKIQADLEKGGEVTFKFNSEGLDWDFK